MRLGQPARAPSKSPKNGKTELMDESDANQHPIIAKLLDGTADKENSGPSKRKSLIGGTRR